MSRSKSMAALPAHLCTCTSDMPSLKIPDEVLGRQFTDHQLADIAKHLLEWEEKAPAFGLSEGEIEDIKEDHKYSHKSQKLSMLRRWKELYGEDANLRNLVIIAEREGWKRFLQAVCMGYYVDEGEFKPHLLLVWLATPLVKK